MFQLQNEVRCAISLATGAGDEIPIGPGQIRHLSTFESKDQHLPSCNLSFEDITDTVARALLADGTKINVMFAPDQDGSRQYTFRMFGTSGISNTALGRHIDVTGIADAPKYFRSIQTKAIKGTAADVARQIASQAGFKADVDSTNDQMTWLPSNKVMSQWLRHIVGHAFADAQSHMQLAITDMDGSGQWALRMKNITKVAQGGHAAVLASLGFSNPGEVALYHHKISSNSGFNNNTYAYGSEVSQPQINGDLESFEKALVNSASQFLQINSQIKNLVGTSFREWLPPSVGNVHKKFAEARNQNRRLAASFSTVVDSLPVSFTKFGILDAIQYNLANLVGDGLDQAYSGKYVVTSRTRHLQGTRYVERISATSQGTNKDGSGVLMSGMDASLGQIVDTVSGVLNGSGLSQVAAAVTQIAGTTAGITKLLANKGGSPTTITTGFIMDMIDTAVPGASVAVNQSTVRSINKDLQAGKPLSAASISALASDLTADGVFLTIGPIVKQIVTQLNSKVR